MRKSLSLLMALSFLLGTLAVPVYAQDYARSPSSNQYYDSTFDNVSPNPPPEDIILDAGIFRPLGIIAIGVGLAGALISLPWAATSCSGDVVGKQLLQKPFDYTFKRPLGDIVDPMDP
jgi:hypothetical protein